MTRKMIIHGAKAGEFLVTDKKGRIIGLARFQADKSGVHVEVEKFSKASKERVNVKRLGRWPFGVNVWYYTSAPQRIFISNGVGSKKFIDIEEVFLPELLKGLTQLAKQRGLI